MIILPPPAETTERETVFLKMMMESDEMNGKQAIRMLAAMLLTGVLTVPAGAAAVREERAPAESIRQNEESRCRHGRPCASRGMSWYCPKPTEGVRRLDSGMAFVENYPLVWRDETADEQNRVLYLTFDAGYENGNVEKILNILKEKSVPGAFFVLEHFISANPGLVERMAAEGHLVCNHTASHRDMSAVTDREEFAAELSRLEQVCRESTGVEMARFYRPPEGKFSEANLAHAGELGYCTVLWSMAYADWDNDRQPSPEAAKEKLLAGTMNGDILLLHPTSATNAAILGDLIDAWTARGYRFGSLADLLQNAEEHS